MDQNDPPTGNGKTYSLQQPWWPGKAQLQHIDYYQLAAQEAVLARAAVTNESRAHHYAMAAYYTHLAEAKEKLARTVDPVRPMPFGK